MEAKKDSKIRFFVEPIKMLLFDDPRNPSKRRNLKYIKLFYWLRLKIILLTLCIPFISITTCLIPRVAFVCIPTLLIIAAYIFKLKVLFQKVSKRINEPIHDLNKGDFIAYEYRGQLLVYIILKKNISLFYLKKIEFADIYSESNIADLKEFNYSGLKIIKAAVLYKKFMRIVPVSSQQGTNRFIKNIA